MKVNLEKALQLIQAGGVISYPTETTFGLGCDPFNINALNKLIAIKQRNVDKGFIVLIKDFTQIELLVSPINHQQKQILNLYWPGPFTFIFPTNKNLSKSLIGKHNSIAVRMSAHPIAQRLCANGPITSTSANISEQAVCQTICEIDQQFNTLLDGIVDGTPGHQPASKIIDLISGKHLR